ncbi:MAG: lipopolysaccharide biosynthesis protein [Elainellaceae cyanobacterium]
MQQHKPLTLLSNFSWTFAGNIVYAVCQWGMLVVLARLGTPEMVGQFTLGLAVTAPAILFTNLQLREIQATDAKRQYEFGDYLGLRILSTAVFWVIIIGVIVVVDYGRETAWIIFLLGVSRSLDALSDVFYGFIQLHEQMNRIAISVMMRGILSVLLLGMGVYLSESMVGGAIGLIIASFLVLTLYDLHSSVSVLQQTSLPGSTVHLSRSIGMNWFRPQWQWQRLQQLAWYALPLGLVLLLFSLNVNIPRYLVEWQFDEHTLGIFAAIASLPLAGNLVIKALGQSTIPRLARYYAEGRRAAFRRLLLKLVGIGALLGGLGLLVVFAWGRELLTLLFGVEYGQQAHLLVWLMLPATIDYAASFLGDGMTAARYIRSQIPLFVSVTTILVIACLWLLPAMGLVGIAIALLLAAITRIVISLGIIGHAIYRLKPSTR